MDRIALDSQCFTYIVDAWSTIFEPKGSLANEQTSLFRLYVYTPVCFYVTPTARAECSHIPEPERLAQHNSFLSTLFQPVPPLVQDSVRTLSAHLGKWHKGGADCTILAETTLAELDVVLSYDSDLLNHLGTRCGSIRLSRPFEYWHHLDIPRGAKPVKCIPPGNPLAAQSWWRW